MSRTAGHVIFGTGAIGLATLDALLRRGETVKMINRSGSAPVPKEVEIIGGDAADSRFTIDVARGAQVVYQTLNPPYSRWVEEFPVLQAAVLAAAQTHGARLVSMPAATMTTRARRSTSRRLRTRCRPATPTSTISSVGRPR